MFSIIIRRFAAHKRRKIMIIYTVKKGDSLYKLAEQYGTTVAELERLNNLGNIRYLPEGLSLIIPSKNGSYRVRRGDSLYSIAMNYGLTVEELLALNPNLRPPFTIYPDQILTVPKSGKRRTIDVNGYCYSYIKTDNLNASLPYLTYLSIFSYNIMPDGRLRGIDDDRIIAAARGQNVAPLMVVANLNEDEAFDSELAKRFLRNDVAQQNFINGIPAYLKQKGYLGINLDFEYVYAENREDYNVFMCNLGERLSREGLLLTTALAPKSSDNQSGILFEGHDYRRLGECCDWIMLMTYDWGYAAGPPLAVSPRGEVEKVVRYATTVIPPQKLLLGLPNYAYDWTLPYRSGTKAKYLKLRDVPQYAADRGAAIKFDSTAATPFFNYRDSSGREHVVWYDDARSWAEKIKLVEEYNLLGVGVWTMDNPFIPGLEAIADMYDIRKVL